MLCKQLELCSENIELLLLLYENASYKTGECLSRNTTKRHYNLRYYSQKRRVNVYTLRINSHNQQYVQKQMKTIR